jgi:hypothetical protein
VDRDPPEFLFLGYCAKAPWTPAEKWYGGRSPGIRAARCVASVSNCLSARPAGWMDPWNFNRATCWNTESEALACVPEGQGARFQVFAYRVLLQLFDASGADAAVTADDLFLNELPALPCAPPLAYRRIGYDVVELDAAMGILGFGCSPLSCNRKAREIPVNSFCLIDDFAAALATARQFAIEQPEPGPFVIIEVLTPSSTPGIVSRPASI